MFPNCLPFVRVIKRSKTRALLLLGLVLFAVAPSTVLIAHADQDTQTMTRFDIPAGPLTETLNRFAAQSGLLIVGNAELTRGKQSEGLRGSYTFEQALERLLESSGLAYRFDNERTVTVTRNTGTGIPIELQPITVDAVLEGTLTTSYAAPDSFSATRTDTPLIETPQSAQSITRQAMADAGVDTIGDAYDLLAGVTRDDTTGELFGDEYIARGFQTEYILMNGNRTSSASTLDVANVERVEVLRGPTAALFGKADPGGLINIVTKQPLSEPLREVSLSGAMGLAGDSARLQQGRFAADLGGPLTDDKRLRYRLNIASQHERTFRQDVDEEVLSISPVLDYRLSDSTVVNLELTHQKRENPYDRGVFFVNGELSLPRDFNVVEGDTGMIDKRYMAGTVRIEHQFLPGWKARLGLYASDGDLDGDGAQVASIVGTTATRQRRTFDISETYYTIQPEITGSFLTGAVEHTVLIGADFQNEDQAAIFGLRAVGGAIDVTNPDFSIGIPAITPATTNLVESTLEGDSLGIYAQDQIDLSEQWKLLVGGRWDRVDLDATIDLNAAGGTFSANKEASFEDSHFSPRVGLVYMPVQYASVYASYAESYRSPANAFAFADAASEAVEAETAKNYEVGFKLESLDGRLNGTFALYRADKKNVLEGDPADPFRLSVINLGEVRGEGVEIDLSGEIDDNWSLAATYTYTDNRTRSTTPRFPAGTRVRNVPRHAASVIAAYRFTGGNLAGLRTFVSAIYDDKKLTDTSATIKTTIPSAFRVNLGASYAFSDSVTASLLVKNVFDEEYYTSAAGQNHIGVGDPRRIDFGISARF